MKKIILLLLTFVFASVATYTYGSQIITLITESGKYEKVTIASGEATVFGFPRKIENITFSKDSGFTIRTLEGGVWKDLSDNITDYSPITGILARNISEGDLVITATYAEVTSIENTIFQKSLKAGWNLISPAYKNDTNGIVNGTTALGDALPYSQILDFTGNGFVYSGEAVINTPNHNLNNNSYQIKTKAELANASLIEKLAYGLFVNVDSVISGSQKMTADEFIACDEVSQLLGLCTNFTSTEVACSSNVVFSNNSCSVCYTKTGNSFNGGTFPWNNNTNLTQILYKQEQVLPAMVNLLPAEVTWSTPTWDYTTDIDSLYSLTEEGYLLNSGSTVSLYNNNNSYSLTTDTTSTGNLEIGLLTSSIKTHNILADGAITLDNNTSTGCVLISSPVIETIPLTAPANFTVTNRTPDIISLSWDAVGNAPNYTIYYGTGTNSYTQEAITTSTSIAISLLDSNKYYYFAITAKDGNGNESAYSNELSAYTSLAPAQAPTNVQITSTSTGSISLSWDASLNAATYSIVHGTDEISVLLGSSTMTGITLNNTTVTGLDANTLYYIKVTALNENGDGNSASAISGVTDQVIVSTPSAPTNIQITQTGATQIGLSWDIVNNATSYKIHYGTGEVEVLLGLSNIENTTSTGIIISSLKPETTYFFGIQALDQNGTVTTMSTIQATTSVCDEVYQLLGLCTLADGQLSSSINNPTKSLLLAGSKDVKLLAFDIGATNDNIKLNDLVFTGLNLDKLSNLRILTPTSATAVSTAITSSSIEFTNLNLTDTVMMDTIDTYYLIADVNTNVINTQVSVTLSLTGSNIKATNGSIVAAIGTDVSSNTHKIDENLAVVAKSANPSKDLSTSALRFSVTASGKNGVTLTSATFDNVLSGYTGATELTVYKDSISSFNIVGTGATTGSITFTANQTVDAGSTNNYIVVINGTVDASANTPSWTVRLSNLVVGSINANLYNNMGEFPLTETK